MAKALPSDANFLGLEPEFSEPDSAGVLVLTAPHEATSTFGRGSCAGPSAILEASRQVELFDAALGFEPFHACGGVATLEPVDTANASGAQVAERLYEAVHPWFRKDKFVVVLGGEHSSVVGAIQAHADHFADLSVLQLDAHSDLREEYEGSPWNHACAMARVLEFHDHLVQAGIRSQEVTERARIEQQFIPVFYAHEIHRADAAREDWITPILAELRPRVYVTFDCDVFDPSAVPGTGTPEPGGLTWYQVDALMARLCAEREVVGLDVSELALVPGSRVSEFTVAKFIYRFLGYRFKPRP